ncbi:MAG: endonuclease III domain-containing protein [Candidatus Omnitrophica bacterium]|nr:endonuclease III domain-containing protein [Candidatus Omnitrophota bacterium]
MGRSGATGLVTLRPAPMHAGRTPWPFYAAGFARTSRLIRPSGYYRLKTKRLRNFISYMLGRYGGSYRRMKNVPLGRLRDEFLSINGIGPETADSILLYALGKPVFVVDAYTKRAFARHGFVAQTAEYREIQAVCMKSLPCDAEMFNEYHALIVKLGKVYCLKNNPRCGQCPLKNEK